MDDASLGIDYCESCGVRMDVGELAPFTRVECPGCGAHTRVKRRFGPYLLERRHAAGGMSMVFAAHDATLEREVALKILNEDYSRDERRITAFEEEARITASLSHPNVVRVFKTGRAFGRFYIAMEMVPGGHLEQRIRDAGQIPEADLLPLAIEVARGLKAAHAAGLIHRDVKPGNILLDAGGHARLVDFGLALVTQGGKALASELWATPYYVPPETIEGRSEDFRSDIYAFGSTLYHALSGKPPCGEETMSTDALREAKKKITPLAKASTGVSAETCRIVDKAMAYEPAGRYESYDELIDDLKKSLTRIRTGHGAAEEVATARRRSQRSRLLLGAAGLSAAVVGLILMAVMRPQASQPSKKTTSAPPPPPPVDVPVDNPVDPSVEIARLNREAREALMTGKFADAERAFAALLDNDQVLEPTRSWAGIEALLAAYLDGRTADARPRAKRALAHLATLPGEHSLAGDGWRGLLAGVEGFPPLASPDLKEPSCSVLGNMLAGLKNWEQGMLQAAADCFKAAAAVGLDPASEWAAVYQKLAGDYLADHAALTSPTFMEEPADRAGCEAALERLANVRETLRTRGRASFNTDAWQYELQRRALRFAVAEKASENKPAVEEMAVAEQPSLDEVLARLEELAATWQFASAVDYLKGLDADPPGTKRSSLLALAEGAATFPADLVRDLAREPYEGALPLKSGGKVLWLSAAQDGGLSARTEDGVTIRCTWQDFTADALIELHRALVKNSTSEMDRLRRHECAIAFDWMAGNRERALSAANKLAQGSPEFQQRWEEILAGLPQ
jgi:tRNA A-37 threonylcarbamoyl transferase component Bud32